MVSSMADVASALKESAAYIADDMVTVASRASFLELWQRKARKAVLYGIVLYCMVWYCIVV